MRYSLINVLGLGSLMIVLGGGASKTERLVGSGDVDRVFTHRDEAQADGFPSKNFGNEVIYQIFIDRFANGNADNDCLWEGRYCSPDHREWGKYWGGDLRGVIEHLPYLKRLGVTRLWMTPIFENTPISVIRDRYGRDMEISSYHGYWVRDWFRLNPAFTDDGNEDFDLVEELVTKAGPQIKIVLDTVVNHTSPKDPLPASLAWLESKEPLARKDGIPRTHRSALFRQGEYVTGWDEDVYRKKTQAGYTPRFHHFPTISDWDDDFQLEYYALEGLADLSQDAVQIESYMRDAHRFWLERFPKMGGYRMDTIKHVGLPYWKNFSDDLFGDFPQTSVMGEDFGAGPLNGRSHPFYRETRMSLFDFSFRFAMADVFLYGKSFRELTNVWENDPRMIDARELVTFLDNHDLPRLRGAGMTEERMRQALALLFVARGVPCVFYGLEQDLFTPEDPGDPYNRPMMESFNERSEMYQWVRRLAQLRKANPALRYGSTHVVHETDNILGFERVDGTQRVFFAMSKNPRVGTDDFTMRGLTLPDGDYTDVLSGKSYQVNDGQVDVSLADGDVILLTTSGVFK